MWGSRRRKPAFDWCKVVNIKKQVYWSVALKNQTAQLGECRQQNRPNKEE